MLKVRLVVFRRVALALLFLMGNHANAVEIDWRLQDANRLFVDGNPYRNEAKWDFRGEDRSAELHLRRLLRVDDLPARPSERPSRNGIFRFEETQWLPLEQRYRTEYLRPTTGFFVAKMQMRLLGAAAGESCSWSVEGLAGNATTSSPCDQFTLHPVPVALHTNSGPSSAPSTIKVTTSSGMTESVVVHPKHYIVLGLGDSYSSGEGNPDQAAAWADVMEPAHYDELWNKLPKYLERSSRWWDRNCHRSLYSWQALSAMRLVAETSSRAAVSFVGFACSGDEFFDGLLYARKDPPFGGETMTVRDGAPTPLAEDSQGMRLLRKSQLNNAISTLCRIEVGPQRLVQVGRRPVWMNTCTDSLRPDVVLMGIGGNDVSFSGVVAGVFLPSRGRTFAGQLGLKAVRKFAGTVSSATAQQKATALPRWYADLDRLLARAWPPSGDRRVVFANYPNPLLMAASSNKRMPQSTSSCRLESCRKGAKPEVATLAQCRVHYNHLAMTALAKEAAPLDPSLVPDIVPGEQRAVTALHTALVRASGGICRSEWRCFHTSGIDGTALNAYAPSEAPGSAELERAKREPTFLHDCSHQLDGLPDWHMGRSLSSWDAYVHPFANNRLVLTFNDTLFTQAALSGCKMNGALQSPGAQGYDDVFRSSDCELDSKESAKGTAHLSVFAHAKVADAAFEQISRVLRIGLDKPEAPADNPNTSRQAGGAR